MSQTRWTYKLPALGVDVVMVLNAEGEAFKEVRRQIARDLREITRQAAERHIIPIANRRATFVRTITGQGMVVRKGTSNSVYLTVLTRKRALKDAVGWVEFGGTVRGPIMAKAIGPKSKQGRKLDRKRRRSFTNASHAGAVSLPGGQARFIVNTPRHFGGKHLMWGSVKQGKPGMQDELKEQLLNYFERNDFEVS